MSAKWWAVSAGIWFIVLGAFWLTKLQPSDYACLAIRQQACLELSRFDSRPFVAVWLAGTAVLAVISLAARLRNVP